MAASAPLPTVERYFQFSLLGMLASGYFALAGSGYLDLPTLVIPVLALAVRSGMAGGWIESVLSQRAVAILTLAYLVFFPLDYWLVSRSLPEATLHLVLFLAVVKLLTAVTERDYAYLKAIAALELLAAAMLSRSLSFFAFLALFLLFTIATFASGEIRRAARRVPAGGPGARPHAGVRWFGPRLGLLSTALFAAILTLTAGMFFVLPRTARAAMGRFMPRRYHLPGFTNEVRLGEFGEITQSNRAVMHVKTYRGEDLTRVYWRGAALSHFDGKRWFTPPGAEVTLPLDRDALVLGRAAHARPGRSVAYRVQLDEIAADTLFFAGTPETININLPRNLYGLRLSRAGSFRVPRLPNGITYSVYSFLEDGNAPPIGFAPPLPEGVRQEMLWLPDLDPRIADLARAMTAGLATDEERARTLEQRLRRDYTYTLELLPAPVSDPLAHFLFVRRKGHCEYFASAMAVMLRTLGIPSRVVAGFQSGVFNSMTGSQVIRASDAHSWVEAWVPGGGWTTFDPTPADPQSASSGFARRIAMFFDAADQFWQDWVLNYDLQRQAVLAARVQESSRAWHFPWLPNLEAWRGHVWNPGKAAMGALVLLLGSGILAYLSWPALAALWRHRRGVRRVQRGEGEASDATMLYQRMLDVLARRGFQKPPWLTPGEFAGVLPPSEMSALVADLTRAYNAFRFGGRRDAAPRIIRLLERLESAQ